MVNNWKTIKNSLKVRIFWNNHTMQNLEQSIKYKIELNGQANIIGNYNKKERRTRSGRKIPDNRNPTYISSE
ncbi:hypothetical protein F8M41_009012 [Gigaspora margarita]|uniref:Uncharacterized protein n=1 Tax=Gigaspora margarita TaxID=4874 RepID=A0A8H4EQS0_GIGMA|nr:hypothetical protein F8M41_009012 [Gigaspora margarita]